MIKAKIWCTIGETGILFMARGASLEKRFNGQSFLGLEGRKATFSPLKQY